MFTYNTPELMKQDNISLVDHLVLVSLRVLVIVREHIQKNPEKLATQKKAVCENQGKQRELTDH